MLRFIFFILFIIPASIQAQPHLLVLGTAQDGGHPHIGCTKKCCANLTDKKHYVVSLALVDPDTKKWWLFEATPDIKEQLKYFGELTNHAHSYLPNGIFITHAHMGHYTGLAQLGREAMGAKGVNVYALPKLSKFLKTNGPWEQLVTLNNITINTVQPNTVIGLGNHVAIQAFTVPHRDEYSETAGFIIKTLGRKYLFIPDIDKWSKWDKRITDKVNSVDIALIDATFYDANELPGRRMDEVPHPFVIETIKLFEQTSDNTKAKIHFIHMNHTNPLLWDNTTQKNVRNYGYNYAQQGMKL